MQESTIMPGADATQAKITEIERLAEALGRENELLNVLESRLNVVSRRDERPDPDERLAREFHLSVLVSAVDENNRRINRLIDELVV